MRRRLGTLGSVALLGLVVAACSAVDPLDPSLGAAFITRDGSDVYGVTIADGVTTVKAAAGNSGGNGRLVFWDSAGAVLAEAETCATWVGDSPFGGQQGAAVRLSSSEAGTRAITVTKNIFGFVHAFNVHLMDSSAANPIGFIAQFVLHGLEQPGGVAPLPWRMCVRVVGNSLDFLVWPTALPQPAWGDPNFGGHVDLDPSLPASGRFGWYAGHLGPGEEMEFVDRTVTDLSVPPPTTTTATAPPAETSADAEPPSPE